MVKANDKQYGGTHYQCQTIQPWDYVTANNLGYLEGTAIKYITRWRHKNGMEDIRKAIHFLEKLVEVETARTVNQLEPRTYRSNVPVVDAEQRNSRGVYLADQPSHQARDASLSGSKSSLGNYPLSFASGVLSAQSSSNTVGRLHGSNYVAGQAWNGIPTDPEFLQNPNALDELHMKT